MSNTKPLFIAFQFHAVNGTMFFDEERTKVVVQTIPRNFLADQLPDGTTACWCDNFLVLSKGDIHEKYNSVAPLKAEEFDKVSSKIGPMLKAYMDHFISKEANTYIPGQR